MRDQIYQKFNALGIDVEAAIQRVLATRISIHIWQLDDVGGFEPNTTLSGGIQATGNYPGKARNFNEVTADLDVALSLIPGHHKLNLHAIYRVSDHPIDRHQLTIDSFKPWVEYAKKKGLGLDFNPTLFSSTKVKNNRTLSSPDAETRAYWIQHCIQARKISEYFGATLGIKSLCNLWIPDGLKDNPASRLLPRQLLKESLDQIYAVTCNKDVMDDSLESKLFGIGVESYTVGSHEFYLSYAMKNNLTYLLDSGHFHLSESVADKLSSVLLFADKVALHISRPVRWDSDHVVTYTDELQELTHELVRCHALDRTYIGLDYFDASINRIAALVIGTRNVQKALLISLLTPHERLAQLQEEARFTELLVMQESIKNLPFLEVYDEMLARYQLSSDDSYLRSIQAYEQKILQERGK